MAYIFEELDSQTTPLGEISLRKRSDPKLNGQLIYEVKLGDEFLMSSLFPEAEIQLSKLGLIALKKAGYEKELDIIVGGLGLGYTAVAALEDESIRSLGVIDIMEAVINWHKKELVPLGKILTSDPRCSFIYGDFFEMATSGSFQPTNSAHKVHAVLLDIDHSPSHWLNSENSSFYTATALSQLSDKLHIGGIFGIWSNDLPDPEFIDLLSSIFDKAEAHIIHFPNPYTGGESSNTVYLAHCKKSENIAT